jgi:hypothetical protein
MGAGFSTSKIPRDLDQRNRSKAVFVRGLIIFKITNMEQPSSRGGQKEAIRFLFAIVYY